MIATTFDMAMSLCEEMETGFRGSRLSCRRRGGWRKSDEDLMPDQERHPSGRKWAAERKHWLPEDVPAGGRKDTETLRTCYQQPDNETLPAEPSEQRSINRDGGI